MKKIHVYRLKKNAGYRKGAKQILIYIFLNFDVFFRYLPDGSLLNTTFTYENNSNIKSSVTS